MVDGVVSTADPGGTELHCSAGGAGAGLPRAEAAPQRPQEGNHEQAKERLRPPRERRTSRM